MICPLRASLLEVRPLLREACMERLVHAIGDALAQAVEGAVLGKTFNEMGAILLCDHTRRLSDALSSLLVSGSTRAEFSRLNQIAFLLNAGSVAEAASIFMSGGTAGLTGADVGRVLTLRIDFSAAEVRDLLPDFEDDGGQG
uniref:Conserved oligomeric Golgi complex subunit 4 C-terminal domain-containing protein n=1 Tax=Prymnesium polylepis TaxID=72548 RepID=A0A7S4JIM0_9EUKA